MLRILTIASTVTDKMALRSIALLFALTCILNVADCRLHVKYEWKQIDFAYPSAEDRQNAIDNQTFVPENVIPVGLEVYDHRLFVTLPRWRNGVPASLAYINLNGK